MATLHYLSGVISTTLRSNPISSRQLGPRRGFTEPAPFCLWSGTWKVVLAVVLSCSACHAHPFHISVAEMEYNVVTKRIEVSLKLHADDLESELERLNNVEVDLESAQLTDLATAYLDRHFFLLPLASVPAGAAEPKHESLTPGARSKVHFVGSELEKTWIWLYFELELEDLLSAEKGQDLAFVNSVLLGLVADQINTVSIRTGQSRHALKMTRKSPWHAYPSDWLKAAVSGPGQQLPQ